MLVGIVGKPNAGKSTFFSAATMLPVKIANYPFTTIEPNVGIGWLKTRCVCTEFGVKDNPVNSRCVNGIRYIPVKLVDLPGLIPGAYRGLGLGNQFLDSVMRADALIHVVDASGMTDASGKVLSSPDHDPIEDVEFIENELDMWIANIILKDKDKVIKMGRASDAVPILVTRLSGLDVPEGVVKDVLFSYLEQSSKKVVELSDEDFIQIARRIRVLAKPMLTVANKADMPSAKENIKRMKEKLKHVIPASADSELALRRAAGAGLIAYEPGDGDFKVLTQLNEQQQKALNYIRENVLLPFGNTGVQQAINYVYFTLLDMIVVYPVEDENRLTDKKGNVLPDAYLVRRGTTAREFAYMIHTDLGKGFLFAINARTKMKIGADYVLNDRDVIKVVSSLKRA